MLLGAFSGVIFGNGEMIFQILEKKTQNNKLHYIYLLSVKCGLFKFILS